MRMCAVPECKSLAYRHNRYCSRHVAYHQKHKCFGPANPPTREERFWAKVEKTDTCWIWKAAKSPLGYGSFGVDDNKVMLAHRYAYELLVGPIPPGLTIDHLCRNPSCVNPAHLEAVTQGENIRRGVMIDKFKEYAASITHCPKGHPLSGDNLYLYEGHRHCKICKVERTRKWRAAHKQ